MLVNNAGYIGLTREETKDGFERQFGVSHLGHFLLTNLLLDTIRKSAPSRIVIVASGAHKIGRIHFNDINLTKDFSVFSAYSQSKLAEILFSFELARRLEGTGVTVNCLNPGPVATNIGVDRKTGFGKSIMGLLKYFFPTPEEGAETSVYLAVSPEVEGVTGEYFYKKRTAKTSERARDLEAAKRLWELSADMTGAPSHY